MINGANKHTCRLTQTYHAFFPGVLFLLFQQGALARSNSLHSAIPIQAVAGLFWHSLFFGVLAMITLTGIFRFFLFRNRALLYTSALSVLALLYFFLQSLNPGNGTGTLANFTLQAVFFITVILAVLTIWIYLSILRSGEKLFLLPGTVPVTVIILVTSAILLTVLTGYLSWVMATAASMGVLFMAFFSGIMSSVRGVRYMIPFSAGTAFFMIVPFSSLLTFTGGADITVPAEGAAILSLALMISAIEWKEASNQRKSRNKWRNVRVSEAKYRTMFDRAMEGIFQATYDGKILTANPSLARIFGYNSPEEMKMSITNASAQLIVNPYERERFIENLKKWEKVEGFTTKAYRKNGEVISISISAHTEHDRSGKLQYYEGYVEEITEKEKSEYNLQMSEKRYRSLYESMIDGYARVDMNGVIVEYNKAFLDMLGYSGDELFSMTFMDITPKKWHSRENRILEKEVMVKGYSSSYEKEYIRKNGTILAVELRTYLIKDDTGSNTGFWAIIKDIRDRKMLEDFWKKYEAIVNTSQDFMTLIGSEYIYEAVNDSFCVAHRKKRQEILGKTVAEIWGNDVFEKGIRPNIDRAMEGFVVTDQTSFVFRSLGERHMDVGYYPYYDDDDELTHIIVISHDITERVKAEIELRKSKEELEQRVKERTSELQLTNEILTSEIRIREQAEIELRNSEEKYRQLVETMTDGVIVIDTEGYITYNNSVMQQLIGYEEEDITGTSILSFFNDTNREILRGQLRKRKSGNHDPYEIEWTRKDGSRIQTTVSPQIIHDEEKNYIGSFGVVTDITERKRAEVELLKAKEEAESANRAKSVFLANISHEIRTPMNAILGFSELLEEQIEKDQHKKYLNSITRSGKTLLGMINDILDLSKIEAGRLDLNDEIVNLKDVIHETIEIFTQKINEKQLSVSADIDPEFPDTLHLDDTRIRQILINLVGNAVKFTNQGSITVRAEWVPSRAVKDSVNITVSIIDTGIGIPQDQQEIIFEAFRQQDGQSPSQYGGTGLGLTIVRRLVEMMGGSVEVKSEIDRGSTFTVYLPNIPAFMETQKTPVKGHTDPADYTFKKARILIVDDVESNRSLLKGFLKKYPFIIHEADNGITALEAARKHKPELILMDIKMPTLNGNETVNIMKKEKKLQHIPVIAVTASTLHESEKKLEEKYDGYLIKPVSKAKLIREIARFLPAETKTETITANKEENTLTKGNPDESIITGHTESLSEAVKVLEKKLENSWKKINRRFIFEEIEEFARDIRETGKKYNIRSLISWAEMLYNQVNYFDMDHIPGTLREFPELIEKLKKRSDS